MKKIIIISFILIISSIGLYFYLIILGGPIPKTFKINGCDENYTFYITDNSYQFKKTHGHALHNSIEFGNAKIKVARCLCDSYLNTTSENDSIEIIKILSSKEYKHLNNFFENTLMDTLKITSVCKNKDAYLQRMMLE